MPNDKVTNGIIMVFILLLLFNLYVSYESFKNPNQEDAYLNVDLKQLRSTTRN
jgi:hypothetical protein